MPGTHCNMMRRTTCAIWKTNLLLSWASPASSWLLAIRENSPESSMKMALAYTAAAHSAVTAPLTERVITFLSRPCQDDQPGKLQSKQSACSFSSGLGLSSLKALASLLALFASQTPSPPWIRSTITITARYMFDRWTLLSAEIASGMRSHEASLASVSSGYSSSHCFTWPGIRALATRPSADSSPEAWRSHCCISPQARSEHAEEAAATAFK
mmetsp:Transcript_88472/g.245726  ORF Transcript_88472/g.245726 Transcript_88472/m.245726 type:complete len:213 (+) Transcript_88472:537-1175(+)